MARAEAERALASDATLGAANNLLANILYRGYQREEARRIVDRGLGHKPGHAPLRATSAILLAHHGRTANALTEIRRAATVDPWMWLMRTYLGAAHLFVGRFDAAVLDLERAFELAPGAATTRDWLVYAYHRAGRDAQAMEAAVRALPAKFARLEAAMRSGFASGAFPGAVRARHEWFVARSGKPCTDHPAAAARDLALLGDADAMFECLREAVERRDEIFLEADPVFEPYRSDPRFTALLRRMNLAE
jgi:tetratricopeptide (TPR) repeat protein